MRATGPPQRSVTVRPTRPTRTTRGKLNRYTAVSIAVALPTFLVNRRWSWNLTRSHSAGREVLPYYLFTTANVTISTTAAWFLAETGASNPALVLATVAVYTTTWVLRFFFLDRILFSARR